MSLTITNKMLDRCENGKYLELTTKDNVFVLMSLDTYKQIGK